MVPAGEHPQRIAGRSAGRWTTCRPRARSTPTTSWPRPPRAISWHGAALEDERFAYFAEASIVFLDLPDAVFRGYEGDDELLGMPRADDDAPFELLRREIARLEPQKVYLPLGVGGHVDHQLCREVGIRLLQEGRALGHARARLCRHRDLLRGLPVRLVERLPGLDDLPGSTARRRSRPDVSVTAEFADITDQLERKIMGINLYESQIGAAVRRHTPDGRRGPVLRTGDGRTRRGRRIRRAVLGVGPRLTLMPVDAPPRRGTDRPLPVLIVAFAVALVAGVVIRVILLPTEGLRGDLDQFVLWVHGIAVGGLGNAYDQNLSFPPVMAYVWGLLAAVQPAFQTVTDASDPGIRALMKLPASLADIGLALLALYALRDRLAWGVAAPIAILLDPGRLRHQRLVGPVREHLPAVRAGGGRLRARGSEPGWRPRPWRSRS